ncbi:MAG TPA: hypothetical protein VFM19_10100 [Candidatus Limnocylindria bacterium]|nr:hypothetical protein [Candidatus Limnocylindria bacterium]
MTEVNGLRLAYRGFVTGLAASYVWLAVAMVVAALLTGDPLAPLRPLALTLVEAQHVTASLAFVLGFALVQASGAVVGMCFAYFFGRFFTVRSTMNAAAPAFAILAWALLATGVAALTETDALGLQLAPILATLAYGILLGTGIPVRRDVTRASRLGAA